MQLEQERNDNSLVDFNPVRAGCMVHRMSGVILTTKCPWIFTTPHWSGLLALHCQTGPSACMWESGTGRSSTWNSRQTILLIPRPHCQPRRSITMLLLYQHAIRLVSCTSAQEHTAITSTRTSYITHV